MGEKNETNSDEFSLLHSMAMGGIYGGDGYTYQERYIVCHIPKWLTDPQFVRFMYEATGDVDVVYKKEGQYFYDHIQVKDHTVTPGEFKDVLAGFVKIDNGTGKIYRSFLLASMGASVTLNSLVQALNRYKEADKFYGDDDKEQALSSTKKVLLSKIADFGLDEYSDFIINKVNFEIGRFDFNDNGTCKKMFISNLVEHPKYQQHVAQILAPVYATLIEQVLAHRGKPLENVKIELLIAEALANAKKPTTANVLHFHNWSLEKFDPEATITIDWSHLFDRATRLVPEADVWNGDLIPQLVAIRKDLAKTTTNRHIVFRGKCSLSASIALGIIFPEKDW